MRRQLGTCRSACIGCLAYGEASIGGQMVGMSIPPPSLIWQRIDGCLCRLVHRNPPIHLGLRLRCGGASSCGSTLSQSELPGCSNVPEILDIQPLIWYTLNL